MARRRRRDRRKRVGRVSYYRHHGAWYVYYREGTKQVRRKVAESEEAAEQIAAQINAQLTSSAPTPFSFDPISVPELRRRFLEYHEQVAQSSLATVRRYATATQHLVNFAEQYCGQKSAHEIDVSRFVSSLRELRVSPNGHPNSERRRLRDKGFRYILEVNRSLYTFAGRRRHLPPYFENPFSAINIERIRIEDAKPIFVFDAATELRFFKQCDEWSFPIHFTLAKTGLRTGELTHLLIEDVDLESGWLHVRNKPEIGWRIKTGRERSIPLIEEVVVVLRNVIGSRAAGPVFLRHRYDPGESELGNSGRKAIQKVLQERLSATESKLGEPLSREQEARLARGVWHDAGIVRNDVVRTTFIRAASAAGMTHATCPKSCRHTFATLLQDANVDPLIRQITLGHKPLDDARGALGMTGVYTHMRAETQKREILRALHLWPDTLNCARHNDAVSDDVLR